MRVYLTNTDVSGFGNSCGINWTLLCFGGTKFSGFLSQKKLFKGPLAADLKVRVIMHETTTTNMWNSEFRGSLFAQVSKLKITEDHTTAHSETQST